MAPPLGHSALGTYLWGQRTRGASGDKVSLLEPRSASRWGVPKSRTPVSALPTSDTPGAVHQVILRTDEPQGQVDGGAASRAVCPLGAPGCRAL